LTLGEPFEGGFGSVVVQAAVTAAREDVVLKVQDPHCESEHEAAALEVWDGDGAVRLLAHDPERHALLLERCVPGTPLSAVGQDEALRVLVELLPRLWKPAGAPFRPLAEEAAWWAENLPLEWEASEKRLERRLLDEALAALRDLAATQGEQVLLHQDLHGDNVLAAQREPWLVIDPKPLAGEREFGLAPIVRSFELGHSRRHVLHRLDTLSSELGLDRERARGWAIGQTIAWAFNSSYHETHVETARWLAEAP
jgi:streptomycin 6-kinase